MSDTGRDRRALVVVGLSALSIVLAVALVVIAIYHFWVVRLHDQTVVERPDDFLILPWEDHNIHALEAYGTLLVAGLTVVIAFLIWRGVRAEVRVVKSHENLLRFNAIQSIAVEMGRIGRWMADHPEYSEALALPANVDSDLGETVALVHADFLESVLSQDEFYPDVDLTGWIRWYQDSLKAWPQLYKVVKHHLDWYPRWARHQDRIFQGVPVPDGYEDV